MGIGLVPVSVGKGAATPLFFSVLLSLKLFDRAQIQRTKRELWRACGASKAVICRLIDVERSRHDRLSPYRAGGSDLAI
jgi:hypothetical protein